MTQRRRPGRRRARRPRLGSALLLAAASAVLPGLAHLRAGRYLAGTFLLGAFLAVIAGLAAVVVLRRDDLIALAVQPGSLMAVVIAAMTVGALWALIVLRSYLVLRPLDLGPVRRAAGSAGVTVLCLAVCAPFVVAAHYAYVQRDLVNSLFSGGGGGSAEQRNAWERLDRLNILLLGSDAGKDRTGVRTDSIHIASIDTSTGRTVLYSLPRNLENAPMPPGPLRRQFPSPQGFTGLLNEVYQYAVEHPHVAPEGPKPGAQLLKQVVAQILGIPVHYYAIVDLNGFEKMVNAMGGVHMCVERPIPYGHVGKVVEAGCRKLNGSEALWYGRSRTLSDDYDRMKRQRCLMDAMVQQADPVTVLRRYPNMAAATKQIVQTDVPQHLLPDLVSLGLKVKKANLTSTQFVPPLIDPAYPDFSRIHHLTREAIQRSERAADEGDRGDRGDGTRQQQKQPRTAPSVVQKPIPPPNQVPAAGARPGASPRDTPAANQDGCG
ncbi:MAG: LytR family transcriptional regulator [Streptosporangiales bacterium]|nr:LytR family transcriptional regulator [Streptosporangiales bacterium]